MEKNERNFIFGIRAVMEAIKAGKPIDKLLVKSGLQGEIWKELQPLITELEIPYQYVPQEKLNRLTSKNHQGVLAFISAVEFYTIEDVIPRIYEEGKTPFIVVLDGVSDVRNFGAIVRSAECAGANAVLIAEKGAAQVNADAVKTSAGAIFNIPICRSKNLFRSLRYMQESGIKIIAATEKASDFYFKADLTGPIALVMGAEDTGISNDIIRISDIIAKIPINGSISSLNVSAAASVVMYEIVKQRLTADPHAFED
ncbi:MAG TPA: 23S rRNA (guanosine(2251)-2'-O)-methyltransferase RlmB [Bacteroidales bacterium]|nr:23S rRNA (guanosine(2251)-2'-O)-methyltransferase RlmB [Bacteroidales bacterium]